MSTTACIEPEKTPLNPLRETLEDSRPVFMYSTPAWFPITSAIVVAPLASSSSPPKTVTLAGASVTNSFFKDAETTT